MVTVYRGMSKGRLPPAPDFPHRVTPFPARASPPLRVAGPSRSTARSYALRSSLAPAASASSFSGRGASGDTEDRCRADAGLRAPERPGVGVGRGEVPAVSPCSRGELGVLGKVSAALQSQQVIGEVLARPASCARPGYGGAGRAAGSG